MCAATPPAPPDLTSPAPPALPSPTPPALTSAAQVASPKTTVTDKITDHKEWTDGDFEIITADNVRFRVPSYHLFSAR